jgi:hypothetical protein
MRGPRTVIHAMEEDGVAVDIDATVKPLLA